MGYQDSSLLRLPPQERTTRSPTGHSRYGDGGARPRASEGATHFALAPRRLAWACQNVLDLIGGSRRPARRRVRGTNPIARIWLCRRGLRRPSIRLIALSMACALVLPCVRRGRCEPQARSAGAAAALERAHQGGRRVPRRGGRARRAEAIPHARIPQRLLPDHSGAQWNLAARTAYGTAFATQTLLCRAGA